MTDYVNRLNSIDTRLLTYVEDAISNDASHVNLYELLGIRKELLWAWDFPGKSTGVGCHCLLWFHS